MKLIIILSLLLTLNVNSQPTLTPMNYEKPEIRRNINVK